MGAYYNPNQKMYPQPLSCRRQRENVLSFRRPRGRWVMKIQITAACVLLPLTLSAAPPLKVELVASEKAIVVQQERLEAAAPFAKVAAEQDLLMEALKPARSFVESETGACSSDIVEFGSQWTQFVLAAQAELRYQLKTRLRTWMSSNPRQSHSSERDAMSVNV